MATSWNTMAEIVRQEARELDAIGAKVFDARELLNVLARILEGQSFLRAFGAPGDWGYGTPIGGTLKNLPVWVSTEARRLHAMNNRLQVVYALWQELKSEIEKHPERTLECAVAPPDLGEAIEKLVEEARKE